MCCGACDGVGGAGFVGGDDVFLAALGQVAMMPCLVLAAKLCPVGIEASLYATFISLLNTSGIGSEYPEFTQEEALQCGAAQ